MNRQKLNRHGFLLIDVIVSISLLTSLFVVLGFTMTACRKYNKYNLVRQRCLAACEGQMDSIAARGKAIDADKMKRLWKDVKITVEKNAGKGQWEGLELVKVHATSKAGKKTVKMSIERYIASGSAEQIGNAESDKVKETKQNDNDKAEEIIDA